MLQTLASKFKGTFSVLLLALLLVSIALPLTSFGPFEGTAKATSWLSGYYYRQELTVTGTTSGAQTDYQVRLTVYKGAGASAGAVLYLANHAASWTASVPNDLRFTKTDQYTELSYWIESSNTTAAIVWVELDLTPANGVTKVYYAYYGKAGDTTTSNGTNTFITFDDFTSLAAWTVDAGNWTAAAGVCSHTDNITNAVNDGLKLTSPPSNASRRVSVNIRSDDYGDTHYMYVSPKWNNVSNMLRMEVQKDPGGHFFRNKSLLAGIGGTAYDVNPYPWGNLTWHRVTTGILSGSGDVKSWINGVLVLSFTDAAWNVAYTGVNFMVYLAKVSYDDFFIANYCAVEPVLTSWAAEEAASISVQTDAASNITESAAFLQGTIVSLGGYGTAYMSFQYGLTTSYGTNTTEGTLGTTGAWGLGVSSLGAAGTYHYRAKLRYDTGLYTYGADATFATLGNYTNWYADYGFRQKFHVDGGTSIGTNYQIPLTVFSGNATSGSGTFEGLTASFPFIPYASNPIITHTETVYYRQMMVYDTFVMQDKDNPNLIRMFYTASWPATWGGGVICTATALKTNPYAWTDDPSNPILSYSQYPGAAGLRTGSVVTYQNTYYIFLGNQLASGTINCAGATWAGPGSSVSVYNGGYAFYTDSTWAQEPDVWVEGYTWHMNYEAAGNAQVKHVTATAPFGPYSGATIIATTALNYPTTELHRTYKLGSTYVMIIEGGYYDSLGYPHSEANLMYSSDPAAFYSKWPTPILKPIGSDTQWDGQQIAGTSLYWDPLTSQWLVYYCGTNWKVPQTYTTGRWDIGVATGASASAGQNVYLHGNAQAFPNDIRMTTSDTVTLMDYWVEDTGAGYVNLWVEIPSIPLVGTDCYVYYGKAGAASVSNGNTTFKLFDEFGGASVDAAKWTVDTGTPTVAGGILTLQYSGGIEEQMHSVSTWTYDVAYRAKAKATKTTTKMDGFIGFGNSYRTAVDDYAYWFFGYDTGSSLSTYYVLAWNEAAYSTDYKTGAYTDNSYSDLDLTWTAGVVKSYKDGVSIGNMVSNIPNEVSSLRFEENNNGSQGGGTLTIDWALVRAYMDTVQPTITTWSSEEGTTPGVSTNPATMVSVPTALIWGTITSIGQGTVEQYGFDWGTTSAYGTEWLSTNSTYSIGTYSRSIAGLVAATTYHFRFKARNSIGWGYGLDGTFSTPSVGVSTTSASSITPSTATLGGSLDNLGGYTPIYCYFSWGLTAAYGSSTPEQTVIAIGGFTAPITGLTPGATYHYQAAGRYSGSNYVYGDDASFIAGALPTTPGAPLNFSSSAGSATFTFTWSMGTNALNTLIRYSTDTYPATTASGATLYFGSATNTTWTPPTTGVTYYFSAWSESGGVYSASYVTSSGRIGVSGGIDTPQVIQIEDVRLYRNYASPGSVIMVVSYKLLYTTNPIEEVGDYFVFQVKEGTTLRTQFTPTNWGYQPASVYQTSVGSLIWGKAYTFYLVGRTGKWSTIPVTSYPITSTNYVGDYKDANKMANWVIGTAKRMGQYYGISYTTVVQGAGEILSNTGAVIFEGAIPGLRTYLPELFSTGTLILKPDTGVYTSAYEQSLNMTTALGAETKNALDTLGGYFGISGQTVSTLAWALMALCVVGGFALPGGIGMAFLVVAPLIALGLVISTISLSSFIALGVILVVYALYLLLFK